MSISAELKNALDVSLQKAVVEQKPIRDNSANVPDKVQAPVVLEDSSLAVGEELPVREGTEEESSDSLGKIDEAVPPPAEEKASPPEPLFTTIITIEVTDTTTDIKFTGDVDRLSFARLDRAMFLAMRELQVTHAALRRKN